ncbi:MAG: hypothetical protein RSD78_08750 [Oscillospiraceae bacterium]
MFTIYKRVLADTAPFTYLPLADNETAVLGTAYKLNAGKLAKAGATDKPTYLCLGVKRADGLVPMVRICPDMELETSSGAVIPATMIGTAVTLGADAATVTSTTVNGVFTVSDTDAVIGGMVRGYFE